MAAKLVIFWQYSKLRTKKVRNFATIFVPLPAYGKDDDTLYDTHGNSEIAIRETFEYYQLGRYFADPQVFYDAYWEANIDLWGRYSKGEITRDYLIVERFRRPLSVGMGDAATEAYCLEMSDQFLAYCSNKPGTVKGAIVLSEDAGVNKPAAGYFEYAFKQTGAKPETTLMIGDNLQTDIKGAMAVGIDALLFNRWGYDIKSGDPEAPTYTVSDLLDIKQII